MSDERITFLIVVPDVQLDTYCIGVTCGAAAFHIRPKHDEPNKWLVVEGPPKPGWMGNQYGPTYSSLQEASQAATRSAAFAEYTRLAKKELDNAISRHWGAL